MISFSKYHFKKLTNLIVFMITRIPRSGCSGAVGAFTELQDLFSKQIYFTVSFSFFFFVEKNLFRFLNFLITKIYLDHLKTKSKIL